MTPASEHTPGAEVRRPISEGVESIGHGATAPKRSLGVDRLLRATRHSIAGLKAAYAGERAFRQEVGLALVMLPGALWLGRTWLETALLMSSVVLVLIVELLNSGIEAAIDRISLDLHELSGRAKDLASAAVFLSILLCGGLWTTALWLRLVG